MNKIRWGNEPLHYAGFNIMQDDNLKNGIVIFRDDEGREVVITGVFN